MPAAWLLLLVISMVAGIAGYPLMQPDEGRNGEVAREMAVTGDFVVPRLNGVPYVDKPVLHYAVTGVSIRAFGANEFAARLPSLVFSLITAALVGWFGVRIAGREAGWAAAVATLSAPLAFGMSRVVILDALLATLVVGAIVCFYFAIESRRLASLPARDQTPHAPWRAWSLGGWALIGLGILTKGPVALLVPLLVGLPYAWYRRARRAVLYFPGFMLMALVIAPWVVLMSRELPDYLHYIAVTEIWQRIATDELHRSEPFWYFVPVLLAGTLPWVGPAVAGLWRRRRDASRPADPRIVFLVLWVVLPFIFFSLSRSKLPHYMLPLVPAVALLAAIFLSGEREKPPAGRTSGAVLLCLLGVAALGASFLMHVGRRVDLDVLAAARPFLRVFGFTAAAVGTAVLLAKPRGGVLVAAFSLPMIVAGFASGPLLKAVGEDRSAKALAEAIRQAVPGPLEVVGIDVYPTTLPFYLGSTIELASRSGRELTSNYVRAQFEALAARGDSTLHPADWWRGVLVNCREPTVFVISAGAGHIAAELRDAGLPRVAGDRRYAVYGPCQPGSGHGS